jgi:hypothetical protein
MDCFEGKPYRKPLFLPPNIGGSCRFSLEAILGLIAYSSSGGIKWLSAAQVDIPDNC